MPIKAGKSESEMGSVHGPEDRRRDNRLYSWRSSAYRRKGNRRRRCQEDEQSSIGQHHRDPGRKAPWNSDRMGYAWIGAEQPQVLHLCAPERHDQRREHAEGDQAETQVCGHASP